MLADRGDGHRLAGGDLGAFSLTREAVQLDLLPRVRVMQTSEEQGQIYVPAANWLPVRVRVVLFVLGFQSSAALTSAYGVAVWGP